MTNEDDFNEIFGAIRANAIAPEPSVIAAESQRRRTQRRRIASLVAVAFVALSGLGLFAVAAGPQQAELATEGLSTEPDSETATPNEDTSTTTTDAAEISDAEAEPSDPATVASNDTEAEAAEASTVAPETTTTAAPNVAGSEPSVTTVTTTAPDTATTTAPSETATTTAPPETVTTTIPPDATSTTTAAPSPTTTATTVPGINLPSFAPVSGASLSGTWDVVSLVVDNELIELGNAELDIRVTGRNLSGNDGCNSFGGVGLVWSANGSITIDQSLAGTTLIGCPDSEDLTSAFDKAFGSATSWGFTPAGNLVLASADTRLDFSLTNSAVALQGFEIGPIVGDTTLELLREGEQFSSLPSDTELPVLTIANNMSTATLSSGDCEIIYTATLPGSSGEGTTIFSGPATTACPEGTLTREVADLLAEVDYGLSMTSDEISVLQLWVEAETALFFATEGSGLDG